MKIIRHRLYKDDGTPYPFVRSPNCGDKVQHEYLVIHYTAGPSADVSVRWLTNPARKVSAHLVIGRDGSITQLVPFDRIAWHAGRSSWEGRIGLNRYSLGIELDNAGRLRRRGNHWQAWFGGEYDDSEVIEAVHKHETESCGWHTFTPEQIEATLQVGILLINRYGVRDVVGHDDISPGRKSDPGPAFSMESFRARLFGRAEDEKMQYETIANLNIRTGPGTQHPTIKGSPLPTGTRVMVLTEKGRWRFVDVLDVVNGVRDMQGWVYSRYLKLAD